LKRDAIATIAPFSTSPNGAAARLGPPGVALSRSSSQGAKNLRGREGIDE